MSNFETLTFKIIPGMPKMSQSNFASLCRYFMSAISCDYRVLRTFYLKSVPAKFQIYLKHIYWVISVTSSSKLSCNPRHPSRNISCNHRHHLLQPSWRRIFSASNNQKTRVDSNINSDYRASSFDRLHSWCRKMRHCELCQSTPTEILKCAHLRPRPWWRWLQLQPSCGSPQCKVWSKSRHTSLTLSKHSPQHQSGP